MTPSKSDLKQRVGAGIRRRYRNERAFRGLGFGALLIGLAFLGFFFYTLIATGYTALRQTRVLLEIDYLEATLDAAGNRDPAEIRQSDFQSLIRDSLQRRFPEVTERGPRRDLFALMSEGAGIELRDRVLDNLDLIGTTESVWLLAADDTDMVVKGHIDREVEESLRRVSNAQLAWRESGPLPSDRFSCSS